MFAASLFNSPVETPAQGFLGSVNTYPTLFRDRTSLLPTTSANYPGYYLSNKIQITTAGALTITGTALFSINGGEFGTTGTAATGDIIQLKADSSDEYETSVDYVLSVGGVIYDTWTLTTMTMAEADYYSDAVGDYAEVVGDYADLIIED